MIKEKTRIAVYYKNQSIAEQNSVDLCWDLLMDPRFKTLRETIYSNDVERRRFRQLVVNSVMATDIVDKELKALRNARWERAFREAPAAGEELEDYESTINRKATIVIEHLIQASDVAHTMQVRLSLYSLRTQTLSGFVDAHFVFLPWCTALAYLSQVERTVLYGMLQGISRWTG